MSESTKTTEIPSRLSDGGSSGHIIRSYPWAQTPLGPMEQWPATLKTTLSICLASNFPIAIYWGPDLTLLYNDAWSPIAGNKHPWAIGQPAHKVWPEIWDDIKPQFEKAFKGIPGGSKDALLAMHRYGYTEECYFDFTFTPVSGDSGEVEGIFNAVLETSFRVISERRTEFLKQLALAITSQQSAADVFTRLAAFVAGHPEDVPFLLHYEVTGTEVALIAQSLPQETALVPADTDWLLETLQSGSRGTHLPDLSRLYSQLPATHYGEPPVEGYKMDIQMSGEARRSVLVFALNPRLRFNADYQQFFDHIFTAINTALANIASLEQERQRAAIYEELDKAKTTFFSNISHEFRTPLTLMLGTLEEVLGDEDTPPKQRHRAEVAHRNALRLLKLVNALLEFSRIESGRHEAQYTLTDLPLFTTQLAANFRSAIEKEGIDFDIETTAFTSETWVDRQMWEQIVFNLLSNAFKYTFTGRISVRLFERDGQAIMQVADTGIGIPEDELPKMFNRFYRVQGASGRSHEGTGIGLSLVRELVKLQGGDITVQSKLGEGTTFEVAIPLGRDHIQPEKMAAPTEPHADRSTITLLSELHTANGLDQEADVAIMGKAPAHAPTVLVVDDNADMRQHVQRVLADEFNVITAVNGEDALQRIRQQTPDLVLTDVMMPVMDGISLLKELKKSERYVNTPVILLTARAGEEQRIDGLDTGANDYLVKPFAANELRARLRSHISIAQTRAHIEQQMRSFFLQAPVAILLTTGPDHRWNLVNDAMLRLVGRTPDGDYIGRPMEEVIPEARDQHFVSVLDRVFTVGETFMLDEAPITLNRFGKLEQRFLKVVYEPMRSESKQVTGIIIFFEDLTSRVAAQKKLEDSELLFRTLANNLPELVWVTDGAGNNQFASQRWSEYTGNYTAGMERFSSILHPGDAEAVTARWNNSLTTGEVYKVEARLRRFDGIYRWHFGQGTPLRDENGRITSWIGSFTDVQDQKNFAEKLGIEVSIRTAQLEAANKELESFNYVASHDLQEPLRKIMTFISMLYRTRPEEPNYGIYLEKISSSAQRMAELIKSLLDYSRLSEQQQSFGIVDLNETLQIVISDMEMVIANRKVIIRANPLPVLKANKTQMQQLFSNLISNSIKYSDKNPVIEIVARTVPGAVAHASLDPAQTYAELRFRDEGIGFEQKYTDQIFKLFQRLHNKNEYTGTGIGLSIVAKIVERHRGLITAFSEPGKGATFVIWLPL